MSKILELKKHSFYSSSEKNEPETANVVAEIIPLLREQGYEFVTVSTLIDFNQHVFITNLLLASKITAP